MGRIFHRGRLGFSGGAAMNDINQAGIDLIKSFEGCKLTSYLCPAGVWTIGWGHTGPEVVEGLVWTQEQADNALLDDLESAEHSVNSYVTSAINDNQFSALVSFVFNLGAGSLHQSTLLKKLNACDFDGAANEFLKWDFVDGQPNSGIARRRYAERSLFVEPEEAA